MSPSQSAPAATAAAMVAGREHPVQSGTHPLVWQDENTFRVHTQAYTDPSVFAEEMERIFSKRWIYIGHESEIPNAGDFKTRHIGMQPVILSRAADLSIHVMVNRCIHRAAVVTREASGNARTFICPYHGWVYSLDGKLLSVSDRNDPGGYSPAFEAPEGLMKVPRIDTYRGFIFASFNPSVEPLLQQLGHAKALIDRKLNFSPSGEIVVHAQSIVARYPGNWKFQAENIVDAYHFMHTHHAFVQLQAKYGDSTGDFGVHKGGSPKTMREHRFRGATWDCLGGHAFVENPVFSKDDLLNGEFGAFYKDILDQHGEDEFEWIAGKTIGTLFPNMGMIHHQIRTWRPISPTLTEVTIYTYDLKDAPAAFNEGMLRSQERFYGPAGHGMADDLDIFARNQEGLAGSSVEWLIVERGLDTDVLNEKGDYRGLPGSEAPQRAFWREWSRLMASR